MYAVRTDSHLKKGFVTAAATGTAGGIFSYPGVASGALACLVARREEIERRRVD
jgi:hypothetical protein